MLKKINRVLDPFERPFIGMLTKEDIGYKLQRHGLAGLCTFTVKKNYKNNGVHIEIMVPRGSVERIIWLYNLDQAPHALEDFYAA